MYDLLQILRADLSSEEAHGDCPLPENHGSIGNCWNRDPSWGREKGRICSVWIRISCFRSLKTDILLKPQTRNVQFLCGNKVYSLLLQIQFYLYRKPHISHLTFPQEINLSHVNSAIKISQEMLLWESIRSLSTQTSSPTCVLTAGRPSKPTLRW